MKRVLAVTFLLLSCAPAVLADGPELPPTGGAKAPHAGIVRLADGSDPPGTGGLMTPMPSTSA
jgi:hypothetical protein